MIVYCSLSSAYLLKLLHKTRYDPDDKNKDLGHVIKITSFIEKLIDECSNSVIIFKKDVIRVSLELFDIQHPFRNLLKSEY